MRRDSLWGGFRNRDLLVKFGKCVICVGGGL